jgi:hypothetical protein
MNTIRDFGYSGVGPSIEFEKDEARNFYIPRTDMPQVDDSDYTKLISFLASHNIEGRFGSAAPHLFIPHQRIDKKRAREMIMAIREIPVLTSKEGFILDGNHRWYAIRENGDEYVNYIMIDLPFEEAIEILFRFPQTMTSNTEKYKDSK